MTEKTQKTHWMLVFKHSISELEKVKQAVPEALREVVPIEAKIPIDLDDLNYLKDALEAYDDEGNPCDYEEPVTEEAKIIVKSKDEGGDD